MTSALLTNDITVKIKKKKVKMLSKVSDSGLDRMEELMRSICQNKTKWFEVYNMDFYPDLLSVNTDNTVNPAWV